MFKEELQHDLFVLLSDYTEYEIIEKLESIVGEQRMREAFKELEWDIK